MEAAQQPLLPCSAAIPAPRTPSRARRKLPPLPVSSLPTQKTQLGAKLDLCHPQREIYVTLRCQAQWPEGCPGRWLGSGVFLGREVLEKPPGTVG